MADMIIDVDYNITKAEAKQNKLNREFDLGKQKAANIREEIKATETNIESSKKRQADLNAEIDRSSQKLEAYRHNDINLTDKQLQAELKRNSALMTELSKEESHQAKLESQLAKQNLQYKKQINAVHNIGEQIKSNSDKTKTHGKVWNKASNGVDKFGKRLKSLIASALFFSLVTKAFTALREEFGKLITETGTKTASLISKLKGNLATIGQTLYQSAKPYIEWLLEKLVQLTQILAEGLAKILGKDIRQMAELAENAEKTADAAEKATASFDTLQKINSTDESSTTKGNFDNLGKPLDESIIKLFALISGAALVLGVILAFSGANIPLGLGLIAIGSIGLATSIVANWDTMSEETRGSIAGVMAIGGALFLVLGLALLLTGAGIPLGIGLILLGAGLLYGAYAMSPGDGFVEKVKNLWTDVKKVIQECITWIRQNVIDDLLGESFGQAFEDLFGDVGLLLEDIVALISSTFSGDFESAGKHLINIIVDLLNTVIDGINLIIQLFTGSFESRLDSWAWLFSKIIGKEVNLWRPNFQKWVIPHIPRLATGAVIPGGSPFVAMLGDQPKGKTNIEAPLETLIEAFKAAQGTPQFTIEATGSMAQLIRLLNLKIKQENTRASIF